jgi:5-methylcytosine-specific restriction enzyme subunit McrC
MDILARTLVGGIAEIERYGLYKEYIQRTEDTSFPRGRIMIGETLRRHMARGRSHAVTASWYEHSTDTAPNRCLKYAIWMLAQYYKSLTLRKGQRWVISELNQAYHLFDKVSLDKSKSFLRDPMVSDLSRLPALRSYYAPVLRIAISIIENRGVSFEERGSSLSLPSMIFDFDVVFEKYLRMILEEKLEMLDPRLRVLDGNRGGEYGGEKRLFDASPRNEKANPDVVVKREGAVGEDEIHALLLDAKYKPVINPERPDVNQAISYAFSYRCHNFVLAQPRKVGGPSGLKLVGTIKDYNFYLANEDPEEEELKFAQAMLELTKK